MKNAIVTGASKGVGFETCKFLEKMGYCVFAISRNLQKMKKLESNNIEIFQLDMTDFNAIKNFYEQKKDITIDLIINNAGGGWSPTYIAEESPDHFNYAYSLNVSGPMYLSKLFIKNMQKSENPTILFVSSLGGKHAYPGGGNYTNAKRGVGGLVDTMRLEFPEYGIKVVELCPGTIDTVEDQKRDIAITAKDMSEIIYWISQQPKHVNINYIEVNHIQSRK